MRLSESGSVGGGGSVRTSSRENAGGSMRTSSKENAGGSMRASSRAESAGGSMRAPSATQREDPRALHAATIQRSASTPQQTPQLGAMWGFCASKYSKEAELEESR